MLNCLLVSGETCVFQKVKVKGLHNPGIGCALRHASRKRVLLHKASWDRTKKPRPSLTHCRPSLATYESQSKPGTQMVYPEPCTGLRRRISAAIYGWDRPLLTFIYPNRF